METNLATNYEPFRDDQRHGCSAIRGSGVQVGKKDLGDEHLQGRHDVLGVVHARGGLNDESCQFTQHLATIISGEKIRK